jgi:hypothetical protein
VWGGDPFRGTAAIADGRVTANELRGAQWQRLFRDVYCGAGVPVDHGLMVRAAALILPPGVAFAGRSAAWLHGAQYARPNDLVEVTTPTNFGPVQGIQVHHWVIDRGDKQVGRLNQPGRPAILATTAERTAWDLACRPDFPDALAWVDAVAHATGLSNDALRRFALRQRPRKYSISGTKAMMFGDPRPEALPESRIRAYYILAGLEVPIPQYPVLLDNGRIARLDLALPDIRFGIEHDGRWHGSFDQLDRDRERLRRLTAAGWTIAHVTRADLRHPPTLLKTLTHLTHLTQRRAATSMLG